MLKAKLVAKGYTQFYGIDYQETFGSLAKLNSIRILLSLVQISVTKVMIDQFPLWEIWSTYLMLERL